MKSEEPLLKKNFTFEDVPKILINLAWLLKWSINKGYKRSGLFFSKSKQSSSQTINSIFEPLHFVKIYTHLKSPILEIFLWKFHRLVLVLIGLIDAKVILKNRPFWMIEVWWLRSRVRPRFFDQVGHQTTNASIGNKYFFTKYCHCQTYQNYEQSRQKLGTFLVNKVL